MSPLLNPMGYIYTLVVGIVLGLSLYHYHIDLLEWVKDKLK